MKLMTVSFQRHFFWNQSLTQIVSLRCWVRRGEGGGGVLEKAVGEFVPSGITSRQRAIRSKNGQSLHISFQILTGFQKLVFEKFGYLRLTDDKLEVITCTVVFLHKSGFLIFPYLLIILPLETRIWVYIDKWRALPIMLALFQKKQALNIYIRWQIMYPRGQSLLETQHNFPSYASIHTTIENTL